MANGTEYTPNLHFANPEFTARGWDYDWKRNAFVSDLVINQILKGNYSEEGGEYSKSSTLTVNISSGTVNIQGIDLTYGSTETILQPAPGGQLLLYYVYVNASGNLYLSSTPPSDANFSLLYSITVDETDIIMVSDLRYTPVIKGSELLENDLINPDFTIWERDLDDDGIISQSLAKQYGPDRWHSPHDSCIWEREVLGSPYFYPALKFSRTPSFGGLYTIGQAIPFNYDEFGLYYNVGDKLFLKFDLFVPNNGSTFTPIATAGFSEDQVNISNYFDVVVFNDDYVVDGWSTISAVFEILYDPNPVDKCIIVIIGGMFPGTISTYIKFKNTKFLRSEKDLIVRKKSRLEQLDECSVFFSRRTLLSAIQTINNGTTIYGINQGFGRQMYKTPIMTHDSNLFNDIDATGRTITQINANSCGIESIDFNGTIPADSLFEIAPIADAEIY